MWKFPDILVLSSSEAMRNSLAEALRLSGMNPIPGATLTESSIVLGANLRHRHFLRRLPVRRHLPRPRGDGPE